MTSAEQKEQQLRILNAHSENERMISCLLQSIRGAIAALNGVHNSYGKNALNPENVVHSEADREERQVRETQDSIRSAQQELEGVNIAEVLAKLDSALQERPRLKTYLREQGFGHILQ